MKYLAVLAVSVVSLLSGCASVKMESVEASNQAKQFAPPSSGKAGVFVYREDTHFGAALKKNVFIDGECIGETAKGVFFYHEVDGDKEHVVSTESEFSPNDLNLATKEGQLYFIQQYIKMGAFVGGAGLEQKDTETGKAEVSKLQMATKGTCN